MSIRPVLDARRALPTMEGAGVKLHRAFGFADIYDEDEANRIVEAQAVVVQDPPAPAPAPRQVELGKSTRLSAIIGTQPQAEPVTVDAATGEITGQEGQE